MIDASLQKAQYTVAHSSLHLHTGYDGSLRIPQANIIPTIRASGSITLATASTTYTLGTPQNNVPTSLFFYGVINHVTAGTTDIHSFVTGTAQMGQSFYFQPQSGTSVIAGGTMQTVTQSCSALIIDSTTPTSPVVNGFVGETHFIDMAYPAGTTVARATVTAFNKNQVSIFTDTLTSGWTIVGNFIVS